MKIIEELDTSMMNDFRKCPRYFELRHVEYLVPKMNSAKSKPEFGSALHDVSPRLLPPQPVGLDATGNPLGCRELHDNRNLLDGALRQEA